MYYNLQYAYIFFTFKSSSFETRILNTFRIVVVLRTIIIYKFENRDGSLDSVKYNRPGNGELGQCVW